MAVVVVVVFKFEGLGCYVCGAVGRVGQGLTHTFLWARGGRGGGWVGGSGAWGLGPGGRRLRVLGVGGVTV